MKYVRLGIVVIVLALAALSLRPSMIPVGDTNLALTIPFAQVFAMRGLVATGIAILGLVVLVVALVRLSVFRRGAVTAVLGAGLLAVAAVHWFTLAGRGMDVTSALPPDRGLTHVSEGNGAVTVLSYNTLGGATSMGQIATVVADNGVDVIVLTETSTERGEALVAQLADLGLSYTLHDSNADQYRPEIESTVVLTSSALGEYREREPLDLRWGSLRLVSTTGASPDIIAVHPVSPNADTEAEWRDEISTVYAMCDSFNNTIMAGDFNSTVDHMEATGNRCTSALDGTVGGVGTWPANVPAVFGSPIDNVWTDLETEAATIVEVGDSDHRGVLVRLARK